MSFRYHLLLLAVLSAASPFASARSTSTESITLVPGWNAVWITVDPDDRDPATVFDGIPVEQVWCYFPTESPVEFIEDPNEGLWNMDGWNVYLPESDPKAFLSDLFEVLPNRPYLIKLSGSDNVILSVSGRTRIRSQSWKPDSFNLVGFPLGAAGGGGFGAFFFGRDAHADEPKFTLSPAGIWTPVTTSTAVKAGQAYWIYSRGESTFNGPIEIEGATLGDLDFGVHEDRRTLVVSNPSTFPANVQVTASSGLPLVVESLDATGNPVWQSLTTLTNNLAAGSRWQIPLGVQRAGLSGPATGILTISGNGMEFRVCVSIDLEAQALGGGGTAGLWVGEATLDQVSDVNLPANAPLVDTPAELSQRLLIHVNAAGEATLLKQVILMLEEGQFSEDINVAESNGRHRLITDDTLIPNFSGATARDGEPVGIRMSAITYDFPGNHLPMGGGFGSTLTAQIVVGRDAPTHPYKHTFHPDHNGKNDQFEDQPTNGLSSIREELWEIARDISLTFDSPGAGDAFQFEPDRASKVRTGTYEETLTGLHKNPIVIKGTFVLRRANHIDELN